jgi:hypothetical protein
MDTVLVDIFKDLTAVFLSEEEISFILSNIDGIDTEKIDKVTEQVNQSLQRDKQPGAEPARVRTSMIDTQQLFGVDLFGGVNQVFGTEAMAKVTEATSSLGKRFEGAATFVNNVDLS